MALVCPYCAKVGLAHVTSMELPAPGIWQELTLQVLTCPNCEFKLGGVYLESRAGRLDSEVVNHSAYRVEAEEVAEIEARIASCPDRRDKRCTCDAHTGFLEDYTFGEPGFQPGFRGRPPPRPIGWDGKP